MIYGNVRERCRGTRIVLVIGMPVQDRIDVRKRVRALQIGIDVRGGRSFRILGPDLACNYRYEYWGKPSSEHRLPRGSYRPAPFQPRQARTISRSARRGSEMTR
jgi:hypothetical protein